MLTVRFAPAAPFASDLAAQTRRRETLGFSTATSVVASPAVLFFAILLLTFTLHFDCSKFMEFMEFRNFWKRCHHGESREGRRESLFLIFRKLTGEGPKNEETGVPTGLSCTYEYSKYHIYRTLIKMPRSRKVARQCMNMNKRFRGAPPETPPWYCRNPTPEEEKSEVELSQTGAPNL